jgi:alpha-mannosidase
MTPLVPMLADAASSVPRFPLAVEPGSFVATSLKPSADGKAWILRLLNASDRAEALRLSGEALDRGRVFLSDLGETELARLAAPIEVPGFGILTLRVRK